MKLAFLCPCPDLDGAEKQLLLLATRLVAMGEEVHTIIAEEGRLPAALREASVSCEVLEWTGSPRLLKLWRLGRHLRRGGYDIAVTYAHARIGCVAAKLFSRAATVQRIPGHRCAGPVLGPASLGASDRLMDRFVDRIIAVSESVRTEVISRGYPPDRVVTIYNGVELDKFTGIDRKRERHRIRQEFGIPESRFVVGTTRRLYHTKGLDCLIEAAAQAISAGTDLHVFLAGEGPDRANLEALASRLGIRERVTFAGFRHDVPAILSAFDLFAIPSTTEGCCNAVLEAMATGLPVVASDIPPLRELDPAGIIMRFFPVKDPAAFSERLLAVIADRDLQSAAKERAPLRARHFSVETMLYRYIDVFSDVVNGRVQ